MKRTRHTPEQIIRKLREAERLLATGKELEEVCRSLEISVQTYHRWKAQNNFMIPTWSPTRARLTPSARPSWERRDPGLPDWRGVQLPYAGRELQGGGPGRAQQAARGEPLGWLKGGSVWPAGSERRVAPLRSLARSSCP